MAFSCSLVELLFRFRVKSQVFTHFEHDCYKTLHLRAIGRSGTGFLTKILRCSRYAPFSETGFLAENIGFDAQSLPETRFLVWGGESPGSIDMSGFETYLKKSFEICVKSLTGFRNQY